MPEHLVALVPMSVRRPDEELELGNRIATLLVALPIAEPDPRARLERIHAETARLKASEQARAASLIIEATGWTPPTINRVLAGAIARPLAFNLVVSNVPGPQVPFYLLGRQARGDLPVRAALAAEPRALDRRRLSYDGGVFFGLAGDRDVLADIDELAADLEAALAEQAGAEPSPLGPDEDRGAERHRARPARRRRRRRRARSRARRRRRAGRRCRGSRSAGRRASRTAGSAGSR